MRIINVMDLRVINAMEMRHASNANKMFATFAHSGAKVAKSSYVFRATSYKPLQISFSNIFWCRATSYKQIQCRSSIFSRFCTMQSSTLQFASWNEDECFALKRWSRYVRAVVLFDFAQVGQRHQSVQKKFAMSHLSGQLRYFVSETFICRVRVCFFRPNNPYDAAITYDSLWGKSFTQCRSPKLWTCLSFM